MGNGLMYLFFAGIILCVFLFCKRLRSRICCLLNFSCLELFLSAKLGFRGILEFIERDGWWKLSFELRSVFPWNFAIFFQKNHFLIAFFKIFENYLDIQILLDKTGSLRVFKPHFASVQDLHFNLDVIHIQISGFLTTLLFFLRNILQFERHNFKLKDLNFPFKSSVVFWAKFQ